MTYEIFAWGGIVLIGLGGIVGTLTFARMALIAPDGDNYPTISAYVFAAASLLLMLAIMPAVVSSSFEGSENLYTLLPLGMLFLLFVELRSWCRPVHADCDHGCNHS